MTREDILSARSDLSSACQGDRNEKRRCRSQLSVSENARSASQSNRPSLTAYCAHCKHPLMIDVTTHEGSAKTRGSAKRLNQHICNVCTEEKVKNPRTPSSRLFKSASVDWTNVGDKIETWFETAQTPEQQVVYNFLEKINSNNQEREMKKRVDSAAQGKSLDEILNNLKKYRARFDTARARKRFNNTFESTSWRVMRHPSAPRQFTRYNATYGDEASRDFRTGTVFATTEPRIGSTFLLHPGWV